MNTKSLIFLLIGLLLVVGFNACGPIRELHRNDPYSGPDLEPNEKKLNPALPTVVILASNQGTEIFDLMAPYHLFSETNALNIVVVAPRKKVLPLWKGLYLIPHMSLSEFDQLGVEPSMIVVPNIADPENESIGKWLAKYQDSDSQVMTVCEGARVIAQNHLYEGSKLTTHHSSIGKIEKKSPDYQWVRGSKYIDDGLLSSTSGVSAAVEGSLVAIEKLLGPEAAERVMDSIDYPANQPLLDVRDSNMRFGDLLRILGKTAFTNNKRIGIYVPQKANELELAAIVDTYNRTLPSQLETISMDGLPVISQHGLLLVPSSLLANVASSFDEVIVPDIQHAKADERKFIEQLRMRTNATLYHESERYIFHEIYDQLRLHHTKSFTQTVFRLLDYNIEEELEQTNKGS